MKTLKTSLLFLISLLQFSCDTDDASIITNLSVSELSFNSEANPLDPLVVRYIIIYDETLWVFDGKIDSGIIEEIWSIEEG